MGASAPLLILPSKTRTLTKWRSVVQRLPATRAEMDPWALICQGPSFAARRRCWWDCSSIICGTPRWACAVTQRHGDAHT